MSATAYPLTWPDGLPRTTNKASSQFRTSLPSALKNVRASIEAFARDSGRRVEGIILSSNVTLGSEKPADTGVAAWFAWDGATRCIAVDRYPKVEDNLQAIHHILEARRTEMRHGGLHIVRQTFKGFIALPAPEGWWQVLGLPQTATAADVDNAYRRLARQAHPDQGGSDDAMARLNAARDAGRAARG
ncbi:J domain-containing protein [Rhizorhabdus wittichii]|uniref:J domain-containing protein n=1 Tax=Rhizorhabdus wittichii TaxID=160791 RepID=A0A975CYE3_9SPHN|nr:J domain-containing protein [Rhizorhabdus wittichii]QTH19627.1 J domain-containing protein [Rhizorhabdus wittichii]